MLGPVFVPTGSAAPDDRGGLRRPTAKTAQRRHFQTVHHALWDMDAPIRSCLIDVGDKPALLQTTTRGEGVIPDCATAKSLNQVVEEPHHTGKIASDPLIGYALRANG
jgi:glucose dehydrogenase